MVFQVLFMYSSAPQRKALNRRGGRVVECTGLENRRRFIPTQGSNPCLSAIKQSHPKKGGFFYGGEAGLEEKPWFEKTAGKPFLTRMFLSRPVGVRHREVPNQSLVQTMLQIKATIKPMKMELFLWRRGRP
jgi:hypothetical protein